MQIHLLVFRVYVLFLSDCFPIYLWFDQIATRAKNDISIITRIPGTTIGAGPFFQRTAILHVMTNAIRVLEPGATSLFFDGGTATLILFFHRRHGTADHQGRGWQYASTKDPCLQYIRPLRVDHPRRRFHWPVYWRNRAWKDQEKGHVADGRQGTLARLVTFVRL